MQELVSIGAAAARSGVAPQRLRAWDASGLLVPARSASGYRLYSEGDVARAVHLREASSAANRLGIFPGQGAGSSVPPAGPVPSEVADDRQRGVDARRLRVLRRLAHTLRSTEQEDVVLDAALDSALALLDADVGALSLADVHTQRYVLVARRGLSDDYVRGIESWRLHEGIAGRAFGMREAITVRDLDAEPRAARAVVRSERLRGYVCVPLLRGSRRLGIVEAFARRPRQFSPEEVELLELVAGWAAPVVEGLALSREVRSMRDERAAVLREWTGQSLAAAEADRAALVDTLDAESARLLGRGGAVDARELAGRLDQLSRSIEASRHGGVDVVPLVRRQVVAAFTGRTAKGVGLQVAGWPAQLPADLAMRLYLLVHGLVSAAVRAAESRVELVMGGDELSAWVDVHDDRDAAPDVDVLAALTPELLRAVHGVGGTLEARRSTDGLPGVRVRVRTGAADGRAALTPRERSIVEALATGLTNRSIAAQLGVSPKTLQNHLTGIYRKLGVVNRAQAVRAVV